MKKTKLLTIAAACTLMFMQSCSKKEPALPVSKVNPSTERPKAVDGTSLTNGRYSIISLKTYQSATPAPNRVVEIGGMSTADGAVAQQWDWFGNNGQRWDITKVETTGGVDYYKIVNVNSGKALDLFFGSTADGQAIRQYPYTGAPSQKWSFEYVGFGLYRIKNKNSGKYATLDQNATTNGSIFTQYPLGGTFTPSGVVINSESQMFFMNYAFADDTPPVDNTTPTLTLNWNGTPAKISHLAASATSSCRYGRVHRISSTVLVLSYFFWEADGIRKICIRRSTDNGVNWTTVKIYTPSGSDRSYWAPDFIKLANGTILLAFTSLGTTDTNPNDKVYIVTSTDNGVTWSGTPQMVADGRSWEPSMIQHADGEIQMFYSSEAPWWTGPGSTGVQQEIRMISSIDNGANWSVPKVVAYTSGRRDGMPVPLILANNKGIVFPIESVGDPSKSPYIVWSSATARYKYTGVGTGTTGSDGNQRRWWFRTTGASHAFGGGPFIVQLPGGQTALSFGYDDGRGICGGCWEKGTMGVTIGNTVAKNFTATTRPWGVLPTNEGAIENSLFLKGTNTLTAVSNRMFSDGHSEIWWKDGTF